MIFKLFSRKVACGTCGDGFEDLEPVPIKDRNLIKQSLLEGQFRCPKCDLQFPRQMWSCWKCFPQRCFGDMLRLQTYRSSKNFPLSS